MTRSETIPALIRAEANRTRARRKLLKQLIPLPSYSFTPKTSQILVSNQIYGFESAMSASRLQLPTLLSSLPSNGKLALVRPSTYPPDSFYLVTRTRLRFSATPSLTTFSPDPATAKGKEKEVVAEVDPPVQAGGVKAHGKAWGMLFWKGGSNPLIPLLSLRVCNRKISSPSDTNLFTRSRDPRRTEATLAIYRSQLPLGRCEVSGGCLESKS